MPLPELPITVDDPTHDTQRMGVRDGEPVYNTQQGRGHRDAPSYDKQPQGPLRYKE